MTITRQMLGAAHDILLKRGLMLSGVMLEEIYDAMEFQRQKDGYSDGDTQDVLLAKITTLENTLRQAREALEVFGWHEDSCTIHDLDDEGRHEGCSCGFSNALAAIDAVLGERHE